MPDPMLVAKGAQDVFMLPGMANRHGLIAGATGTGKTVTLQSLAEHFSAIGVPVVLADVKGDLAGISQPGGGNEKVDARLKQLGIDGFAFSGCPVTFWDVFDQNGHPVRATISDMGPLLLSRLLNLNDTQAGVLSVVFRVADDNGFLLLDLKDLRAMLQYAGDNAKSIKTQYGNVSAASVGAIQRGLIALEDQGADHLFGEPALDLDDLIQTDGDGRGMVNILVADQLINSPSVYSTLLLWLLSELFERLPEVGDPEKPKLVFFFDEAHLLFDDAPKVLLDKIEQVVRLVRSKGVGVYFVTQNPLDVPDDVLGQLGNRVQHALRAFTPRDQKAVKAAGTTFRAEPEYRHRDGDHRAGGGRGAGIDARGEGNPVSRGARVRGAAAQPHRADHDGGAPEDHRCVGAAGPLRPGPRPGVGVREAEGEGRAVDRSGRGATTRRDSARTGRCARACAEAQECGPRARGHGRGDGEVSGACHRQPARPFDLARAVREPDEEAVVEVSAPRPEDFAMSPGEHPDNPPTRPAPRRLEVTMSSEDEVWIRGDKAGLEYLADWCHRIIGKERPVGSHPFSMADEQPPGGFVGDPGGVLR